MYSKSFIAVAALLTSMSAFALDGGSSSVGVPNPAAELCLKLNGTVETVLTPAGEGANCVVDEWVLFRSMTDAGLIHSPSQPRHAWISNPASKNCITIGGTLRMVNTPAGEAGHCVIEEWTLFKVYNPATAQ